GAKGPADRKRGPELLVEIRHQHVRHVVESGCHHDQSTRAVLLLKSTENSHGVLAVRARSQDERQQHHLALVLSGRDLSGRSEANRELWRGPRRRGRRGRGGRSTLRHKSKTDEQTQYGT